jgi:ABC-2 type transport system permease protein
MINYCLTNPIKSQKLVIAKHEWTMLLKNWHGWLLLTACQSLLAWVILRILHTISDANTQLPSISFHLLLNRQLFGATAIILLLIAPLFTCRALRKDHGYTIILMTAPITSTDILFGYWIGYSGIMIWFSLLPLILSTSMAVLSGFDWGMLITATLGLCLLGALFVAISLFAMSLVNSVLVAYVLSYSLLLLFPLLDPHDWTQLQSLSWLAWLSWQPHLSWFFLGVIRLSDIAYFVLLSLFFLILAQRLLRARQTITFS